jgi:hypothetical protein
MFPKPLLLFFETIRISKNKEGQGFGREAPSLNYLWMPDE